MDKQNIPVPPTGYASWLDFAVETFDTRGVWVENQHARGFATKPSTDQERRLRGGGTVHVTEYIAPC